MLQVPWRKDKDFAVSSIGHHCGSGTSPWTHAWATKVAGKDGWICTKDEQMRTFRRVLFCFSFAPAIKLWFCSWHWGVAVTHESLISLLQHGEPIWHRAVCVFVEMEISRYNTQELMERVYRWHKAMVRKDFLAAGLEKTIVQNHHRLIDAPRSLIQVIGCLECYYDDTTVWLTRTDVQIKIFHSSHTKQFEHWPAFFEHWHGQTTEFWSCSRGQHNPNLWTRCSSSLHCDVRNGKRIRRECREKMQNMWLDGGLANPAHHLRTIWECSPVSMTEDDMKGNSQIYWICATDYYSQYFLSYFLGDSWEMLSLESRDFAERIKCRNDVPGETWCTLENM